MPEIGFFVEGLRRLERAMTPTLALALRVVNSTPEPVHSMLVRCQVQIEPARRRYTPTEQSQMEEIFAAPERWGETLRPFAWQQVTAMVGGFTGTTVAELQLPCSLDFSLAATKYFEALDQSGDGHIPLLLLFSGTVFYATGSGVQAAPIAWNLEARCRLPVRLWRDCVAAYYPDCAWLRLQRDVFDRLQDHRVALGHATCEQTLEALLSQARRATMGGRRKQRGGVEAA